MSLTKQDSADVVVTLGDLKTIQERRAPDYGDLVSENGSRRTRSSSFFTSFRLPKRKRKGERIPLVSRVPSRTHIGTYQVEDGFIRNEFPDSPQFTAVLREAEEAIDEGVLPTRISQGSSGSYFVRGRDGVVLGVFKPRDEEPYGRRNPKWIKWMQRVVCPCCFGRGCLPPNCGYLSEAGAWLVDHRLGLSVVPETRVVRLSASSFNYTRDQKARARLKERIAGRFPDVAKKLHIHTGLPYKVGSFQRFVTGYSDAEMWLRLWGAKGVPSDADKSFRIGFERLVILDYIIRNTDRGNDNWLIKCHKRNEDSPTESSKNMSGAGIFTISSGSGEPPPTNDSEDLAGPSSQAHRLPDVVPNQMELVRVEIAAIDNGLAFPFKHPDEWRAYPFHWAWLPMAKEPFSRATASELLPKLDDAAAVRRLCHHIRRLFRSDSTVDKTVVENQLAVMRGQIFNLREALRSGKSPWDLVHMPVQLMMEVRAARHRRPGAQAPSSDWHESYTQKVPTRYPFFSHF